MNKLTVTKILSIIVIFVGMTVVFGWVFDIGSLKSILPTFVSMKFSTSVCFVFSGVTLYFISRFKEGKGAIAHLAVPASGLVIFLFMITLLLSSFISIRTGVEDIFVKEVGGAVETTTPGRPSVATMLNFILIILYGIFSMSNSVRLRQYAVWFGYTVTAIGTVAVLGYVINLPSLYYSVEGWSTAMALHTSILFVMLGSGIILLRAYSQETRTESLKIGTKLLSLFLTASIIPIVFIGTLSYSITRDPTSVDSFGASLLMIGGITTATIAIFAFYTSKSIVKPILKIRDVASQIAKGDLSVGANENSTDELGELAKAFNYMIRNIKLNEELKSKTERLSAIGTLSARLAHDIRNPLSVIKSTIDIIKIKNPDLPENIIEDLSKLDQAVLRMTHHLDDVLDFVKPKPLNLERCSVSKTICRSLERITKPADVKFNMPSNDVDIMGDPEKLETVFVNLITNAIQAMSDKGEISIRIMDQKENVIIEIEDTGSGIPDDVLPKIFDPLFTTKQIGTGLGLVSCKAIVEKHGGTIEVKTELGKGTTFIIKLPKYT
jgi:signal transduction histidine kinase